MTDTRGESRTRRACQAAVPDNGAGRLAQWLPVAYAGVAGAWVCLSHGVLLAKIAGAAGKHPAWSILEGIAFVAVTAVAIHLVLRRAEVRLTRREQRSRALIEQLQERLQETTKLESIGQVATGVVHDVNNLLTVILGCADSLRRDLGAGVPADPELVADIAASGESARDMTRQLLALARRQGISPEPIDLNALVRGTERLLRRVLGDGVQMVVSLDPGLWKVRCDPGQIEQVILNLAVNARYAMPDGGTLTIETANEQVDTVPASHPSKRAGPFVRLAIRDTGHGMTPEVKARAFEPFFTTKPKGLGTGLGLAIVNGVVKQSHGYVLIESEPRCGTTFEVFLPPVLPPAAIESSEARSSGTE